MRRSIVTYFEDCGFDVLEAADGVEGIKTALEQRPDIVLTDLRMPEADGRTVILTLKDKIPEIPVVILSGTGVLKDAVEAMHLGAWDYISKPVMDMDVLEHTVMKTLERAELRLAKRRYDENLEKTVTLRTRELLELNQKLQEEVEHNLKQQAALQAMTESMVGTTGQACLERIADQICGYFDVDTALVSRYDPDTHLVTPLAHTSRSELDMPRPYTCQGTPCEKIFTQDFYSVSGGIAKLFPNCQLAQQKQYQACAVIALKSSSRSIIGLISIFDIEPIEMDQDESKTLDIVASRASSEIERMQVEDARRNLVEVIEQSQEAFIITLRDTTIVNANAAFGELTQHSRDEWLGRSLLKLFDSEQNRDMWDALAQGNRWFGVTDEKRKDDSEWRCAKAAFPLRDNKKEITNYAFIVSDVTRRESINAQIRQSQKLEALGTLAGGIAHDFNNILSSVIGYSELLLMDLPEDTEENASVREIHRAGERAADLVAQILTFSSKTEQALQPTALPPLLREVIKLIRGSLPSTIEIKMDIDENAPLVVGDATQIHQVVMNLCTNAYHTMRGEGGTLGIRLYSTTLNEKDVEENIELSTGDYVVVEVSDTGTGIEKDIIKQIFEPYFSTKKAGEGTGLGLATVHGILRAHNGSVDVESEVGLGSTFRIYLPAIRSTVKPETKSYGDDHSNIQGNEHVLLVDDESSVTKVVGESLRRLGYEVTPVCDSTRALQLFSAAPWAYDILITDQTMPGVTGSRLTEKIM